MGERALSVRAVFLDRDGVLNEALVRDGRPYPPRSVRELRIIDTAASSLERLQSAGFLRIVVTNQPDVARGILPRRDVDAINDELARCLPLDAFYTCYHNDDDGCDCRKPLPGLLLQAAREHGINLTDSFMIGDRWRDVAAAAAAGVRPIFIDYQYAEKRPLETHEAVGSLEAAVALILRGVR